MIVGKTFHFDASHYLPNYNGKCRNLHGHTWTMDIEIEGLIDEDTGIVIDFVRLREMVDSLLGKLDHRNLNDLLDNPTCENLVNWVWSTLSFLRELNYPNGPRLYSIKIQEGAGGWAKREGGSENA